MEPNKICLNCKFWTAWPSQPDPNRDFGDCRRHAPQVFQTDPGARKPFVTKFPSTNTNEFCGSFRPRIETEN
jgi:hypothetical protein